MGEFWPELIEFHEAVQSPRLSFRDPELQAAKVESDALGPKACSGNFASVYHLAVENGQPGWAVKCFTRKVPGLQARYRAICDHLQQARLPFTVQFQYLEEGIRIRDAWFPILKMDWIEGQTLNTFVDHNLSDPGYLGRLYDLWLKLEPFLRSARTAHGDLQHGNVLMVPGQSQRGLALRLIDYDGLWTPGLATTPPGEAGHEAYRHPNRAAGGEYTADIDRFPHLVIAAALRCLSQPGRSGLWHTFQNGDNLLFQKHDFASPADSPLLHQLWDSGDEELRAWAGLVANSAKSPFDATPLLVGRIVDGRLPPLSPEENAWAKKILGLASRRTKASTSPTPAPQSKPRESTTAVPGPDWLSQEAIRSQPEADQPPENKRSSDRNKRRNSSKQHFQKNQSKTRKSWSEILILVLAIIGTAAIGMVLLAALFLFLAINQNRRPVAPTFPGGGGGGQGFGIGGSQGQAQAQPIDPEIKRVASELSRSRLTLRRREHASPLFSVAFAPDGRTLAAGCMDKAIILWDVATGREIEAMKVDKVTKSLAFAPDGKLLASVNSDDTIKLWDVTTRREVRTLKGNPLGNSIAFAPDGRSLVSGSNEGTMTLWDVSTGGEIWKLKDDDRTRCVVFSPDGNLLASGGVKGVKLWSVSSGVELPLIQGNITSVKSLAFAPDSRTLAAGTFAGVVHLLDIVTGQLRTLTVNDGKFVAFALNGQILLASSGSTIRLWDASSGQELQTLKGHDVSVEAIAVSLDSRSLAVLCSDKTIKLWGTGPPELTALAPALPENTPLPAQNAADRFQFSRPLGMPSAVRRKNRQAIRRTGRRRSAKEFSHELSRRDFAHESCLHSPLSRSVVDVSSGGTRRSRS